MKRTKEKIKIHKLDKAPFNENLYAIRVESDKYIGDHIIKFIQCPKMSDKWLADIFIERIDEKTIKNNIKTKSR